MILRFEIRVAWNTLKELGKRNPTGAFILGISTICAGTLLVLGNAILMQAVLGSLVGTMTEFFVSYLDIYCLLALAAGIVGAAYSLAHGHLIRPSFLCTPIHPASLLLGQMLPVLVMVVSAMWLLASGAFIEALLNGALGWHTLILAFLVMMTLAWIGMFIYTVSDYVANHLLSNRGRIHWLPSVTSAGSCLMLIGWNTVAMSPGSLLMSANNSWPVSAAVVLGQAATMLGLWTVLKRFVQVTPTPELHEPVVRWRIQAPSVASTISRWSLLQLFRDRGKVRFIYIFVMLVALTMVGIWYKLQSAYSVAGWGMLYVSQFVTCTVALASFGHDSSVSWIYRTAPIRYGHVVSGKAAGYVTWSLGLFLLLTTLDSTLTGWGIRHINVILAGLSTTLLAFFVGTVSPVNLDEPASVSPSMSVVVFGFATMAAIGHALLDAWSMLLPVGLVSLLVLTRLRLQAWPNPLSMVEDKNTEDVEAQ